jgi:branched-chain amino acid transport system ATP-binding protein
MTDTPLLEVKQIDSFYGNIQALHGVSLRLMEGEILTLIGANGAGKTSTLRSITGLLRPKRGEIWFRGERIDGVPAHQLVGRGLAMSPEGRRIFARMTVLENLEMGSYLRTDTAKVKTDLEWVFELFPRIKERLTQRAGTLSGGEQQMLAIGRALLSGPRLLLLDEPSLGLAPLIVKQIFEIILEIHRRGVSVLLVEQNARQALAVAHRAYLLETGKIVMEGPASQLAQDPKVKEAYLGLPA